jgi:hypothetical protein
VALPLVPALSPGWPHSGALGPLVLAIPLAAYGVVRARRGTLTPAVLLLAGVLASPSRGLLVYCPWVLLVPFGLRPAWRTDRRLFA